MSRPKSGWVAEHADIIRKMYVEEDKSMQEIADVLKTNVQRVFRALKSLQIERRSRSEAQKNALKTGRTTHPTAGKPLSEENKKNLSEALAKAWANLSPEEYQKRQETSRKQYAKMSDKKKNNLRHAAAVGVLKAAKEGSKLEHFLVDGLTELGYNIVFHKKGAIINDKLEIDILIPSLKIAVEVDGIYHSENVFGDLAKVKNKDSEKNGLLLNNGYVMIRLSNTSKSDSQYYFNKKLNQLVTAIKAIEQEFPPADRRLIYLGEEN